MLVDSPTTAVQTKLTRTFVSPPPVANRPFPCGWKSAEYMGAFSACQLTIIGEAFMMGVCSCPSLYGVQAVAEPSSRGTIEQADVKDLEFYD